MLPKLKVLFLCTGNSCRSQMAEGWARHLKSESVEAYSAGTQPQGINLLAARVMAEVGVDIRGQKSKHVNDVRDIEFDYVVTVCDAASEACPLFPGSARVIHVAFDDPPKLAATARSNEEALSHYRRVRDEIRGFVETLPEGLMKSTTSNQRSIKGQITEDQMSTDVMTQEAVREKVREGYGKIAESGASRAGEQGKPASGCCGNTGCCGSRVLDATGMAKNIGYSDEELAGLPGGANLGLSCGNPTAIASLQLGEVVLDLGSGGGFDCFIAGPKVGAAGGVIGVDMTPQMISRARRNLAGYRERTGLDNVEFRLGEIEHLPIADASVDAVISNCVLNLSPDKTQVWREIARVLKPGGRVAVSDLALLRPLPQEIREMVEALVGCIARAVLVEETHQMMQAAGLGDIRLTPKPGYVAAFSEMQDPLYRRIVEKLPAGTTAADFITSLDIAATKRA